MPHKLHEANLEGLRGLAAFMIVFCHIFTYKQELDPNLIISAIGNYTADGHFSVLIFFCLSGYVIGISNKQQLKTRADVLAYLKKRFIRLYPIYLVSILSIVCFINSQQIGLLIKHLFFGQVLLGPVFYENNPLWSLNYEVIFYLLFIPLSLFELSPKKVLLTALTIAFINTVLHSYYHTPSLLSSYLLGFVFWLSGLILSQYSSKKNSTPLSANFVVSTFCLILASKYIINLPPKLAGLFNFPETVPWISRAIPLSDMLILPFCVAYILLLTNINFRYRKAVIIILYAFPLLIFANAFLKHNWAVVAIPVTFYCASLLLLNPNFLKNTTAALVKLMIYLGSISYAVYAMHFPILSYFHSITFFSGSIFTFNIRMIIFFIILIGVCVFLEKYMQPKAKKYLNKLLTKT